VAESEVIQLISKILSKPNQSDTIREYSLSALIKLYSKFNSGHSIIAELIKAQTQSNSIEVQKRALEYLRLLDTEWDGDRSGICEQIPPSKSFKSFYQSKPVGETEIDEYPPEAAKGTVQPNRQSKPPTASEIEFELQQPTPGASSPSIDLIGSLFNISQPATNTSQPNPVGA
jgi:hypothetical protein